MSESARIAFQILVDALLREVERGEQHSRHAFALKNAMRIQHWPRMNEDDREKARDYIMDAALDYTLREFVYGVKVLDVPDEALDIG